MATVSRATSLREDDQLRHRVIGTPSATPSVFFSHLEGTEGVAADVPLLFRNKKRKEKEDARNIGVCDSN